MSNKLIQLRNKLSPIFKHYGVIRADVFGSMARGQYKPGSDLDLVVTLKNPIGLFKFDEMNEKLEHMLNIKVDVLTHQSINHHLKPYIIKDLIRLYEEKR